MNGIAFEPVGGASGNMILGALIDLGADSGEIEKTIRTGGLDGFHIAWERRRDPNGIACVYCDVLLDDGSAADGHDHEADAGHGHRHHGHDHGHDHEHDHDHGHGHQGHRAHRGLADILGIIERSEAPERAKARAAAIFRRLGEAEAAVHDVDISEIHFHEVGAVDSIVDIFGIVLALEQLNVERVWCSPLRLGRGTIRCAHGIIPVPAPATVKLIAGHAAVRLGIDSELTTPTGAAVLTTLSDGDWQDMPLQVLKTGTGHGTWDFDQVPNTLRAHLLDLGSSDACTAADSVRVLEADIDDQTAETLGQAMTLLIDAGALDVSVHPLHMKKNRTGCRLTVLARPDTARALADVMLQETSTIGVRVHTCDRIVLARSAVKVQTPWGPVAGKRVARPDGIEIVPEFESCRELAARTGLPLRRIMDAARSWE